MAIKGSRLKRIQKNIIEDFVKGFSRGLTYRKHFISSTGMKPILLEIMITERCNARCKMCTIWRNDGKLDLTLEEIERLLSSELLSEVRWVTLTGGEPFLRKDFLKIIHLVSTRVKNLDGLLLATNGLLTKAIIGVARKSLDILPARVRLRVGISFDGVGQVHDQVRGVKGIHEKSIETLRRLKEIDDNRLYIQGHIVISPYNLHYLKQIYSYYSEILEKIVWIPIMISDNYFDNINNREHLTFSEEDKIILSDFFKTLIEKEPVSPSTYYYWKVLDYLRTGVRTYPCTGSYSLIQIDSKGNVNPCSVIPPRFSFGNVRSEPLETIWCSDKANNIRKSMKTLKYCRECINHCDIYASIREEFFSFVNFNLTHPIFPINILKRYFLQR